jgi:hypothetical protein
VGRGGSGNYDAISARCAYRGANSPGYTNYAHGFRPARNVVPRIDSHPQPLTVSRGASTTLTVAATGNGTLTYQWQKDGVDIPGATSSSFSLAAAQPWHIGDYRVKVTDSAGMVTSELATLNLNGVDSGIWKGLLGYYEFDGNGMDHSILERNGSNFGATGVANRFGDPNRAYYFNGNAYVTVPSAPVSGKSPFTISFWTSIESQAPGSEGWLIAFGQAETNQAFHIGNRTYGGTNLWGSFWNNHSAVNTPLASFNYDQFFHFVAAFDGTTLRVFRNGSLVGSSSQNLGEVNIQAGPMQFGKQIGINEYFKGSLDAIRLYNRVLSPTEISALYAFEATQANNADLSGLSLESTVLEPSFSSGSEVYTASVANSVVSTRVTATTSDPNATIEARVNTGTYAAVTSGSPSAALPLNVGTNTVDVRVTAQDGTTQKTYTVTVTRMAAPTVTIPTATSITATGATLGGNVTADGGSTITERGVVYAATANNPDPLIGGAGVTKVTTSGTNGLFTVPVTALAGGTDYRFKAYATNSEGTSYTSAASFITLSNNADLSDLVLDGFTFSPAFSAATGAYTATVQRSNGTVRVRPSSAHAGASLSARINGGDWLAMESGDLSLPLNLQPGENTVEVHVIAEDGSTEKTYTLEVFRNDPRPDAMVGSSLAFMGGTNVYASARSQQVALVSQKARPVFGYVSAANRGGAADRITLRSIGESRFFAIDYRNAQGSLVTAAVKAGTYLTPELEPDDPADWLEAKITPVKRLIQVKNRNTLVTLRKVHTVLIQANSVLDPAVGDGVSIRVETR